MDEEKIWIWGLDGSGMEVDDEIVRRGEQVAVSSDETFFSTGFLTSAVNCNRFFTFLTINCRGEILYFTRVSQSFDMCEMQFS